MQFARRLGHYIDVDIYGGCGNLKCPRTNQHCFSRLKTHYRFYLAFENSNCKDYITEKLFWNAYKLVLICSTFFIWVTFWMGFEEIKTSSHTSLKKTIRPKLWNIFHGRSLSKTIYDVWTHLFRFVSLNESCT